MINKTNCIKYLYRNEQMIYALQKQLIEAKEKNILIIDKVSHELRNPLATIITAITLIEHKSQMGEDVFNEVEIVKRQCALLLMLADEILN